MKLKKLFKYFSKTVHGKIKIKKLEKKFTSFYSDFDYNSFRSKYGVIADKLEEFNEDLSRYEPIDALRNENPDYYISKKELMDFIKKMKNEIEIVINDKK